MVLEVTFGGPLLIRCRRCNLVLDDHVIMNDDDAAPAT